MFAIFFILLILNTSQIYRPNTDIKILKMICDLNFGFGIYLEIGNCLPTIACAHQPARHRLSAESKGALRSNTG